MTGAVIPLRPEQPSTGATVTPDPEANSAARALYVAQRTLDDGAAPDELAAWYKRRDDAARRLLTHLDESASDAELDARVGRLLEWLEAGPRRRSEHITVYARTLSVPHIDRP